jgi:hypothetical protein
MTPKRIQRKRTKGWRLPPNTICVSRPSKWGNPFRLQDGYTAQEAVDLFRAWLDEDIYINPENLIDLRSELGGKNLACWCQFGEPCHAVVLLKLANDESE